MKFYITRHGQTEDNVKGILTGQNQGVLTELGIQQAQKLGLRLKNEVIDFVYSSDLERAVDTARNICEFFPMSKTIQYNELLRERNYGGIAEPIKRKPEGMIFTELPNVESPQQVFDRIKKVADFIINKHDDYENILVVAHGSANRLLVAYLLGYDTLELATQVESQKNAAINIIEIDKETRKANAELLNCDRHLNF
ncbi:MAG: Histidine phosphatase family protein [uncultured Campylobacterales bacterium]|uniref:Histidine phosphatase family protein n=1 Tax=uncultured Campylobacterales bacterium TaxID=352960 RepID=A0A6S6S9P1_9BACT|nr:MAG: Histidine phosphatase family protein [uncultured Campylobacterales bacterium]